jgi:Holliday junction resolvase
MKNKAKGSNAERELLLELYNNKFAVARVAGSGSSKIPCPDIIALKNQKGLILECKTKIGEYLNIKPGQIEELKIFERLSGFPAFIVWRLEKNKWYFIHYSKMKKTKKAFSIKKKDIIEKGSIFSEFIKEYK